LDGILLEANQTALNFAGLRPEDVINRPFWDCHWWTLSAATQVQLQQAIAQAAHGESVRYEVTVLGVDQQVATLDFSLRPLRDESGNIVLLIPEGRDISDRIQAEAARLQTEKIRLELTLLEQILEIILAGYWDWDIPGNQEYLSPGFKRMFGYADHELPNLPESWQNIIFPEDLPKVFDCFEQHVQSHGEIPFYNEVKYRHKDGSVVWVMCSGQVIEWDSLSQPLRMIGCHIDITKRKQAEEQLHSLSDRLALAVKSAAMGIWDWDILQDVLTWDDRMYELYGVAPDEFANVHEAWASRLYPGDRSAAEAANRQALQGEQDYNSEFRIVLPDGTTRFIQAHARP
ncbi:MAG: PAS domain-containing protein, partial [Akkermansiaceae bacterium]|nr:PAS domain-containing protein [Akkermansiaceae bacterium]